MATVTEVSALTNEVEPEGLYEFVDGKFLEKPPLGAFELALANILGQSMSAYLREKPLGRVFIEMIFRIKSSPRLDRRPDIAFVSNLTWPMDRNVPRTAAWKVVPDLAIEVISPFNRTVEDARKVEEYFEAGTKAVWVILPDLAKIYVYSAPNSISIHGHGDILDASPVLPGFQLVLADLFGEPDSESV